MSLELLTEIIPKAPNFTWAESLYLPSFNIHAIPDEEVIHNIKKFAPKVQKVRKILKKPMLITSWWRPDKYNKLIGGSAASWHITGGACDFRCPGLSADEIREILRPKLSKLGLRMENLPGSNWVHIDDKKTRGSRFFRP